MRVCQQIAPDPWAYMDQLVAGLLVVGLHRCQLFRLGPLRGRAGGTGMGRVKIVPSTLGTTPSTLGTTPSTLRTTP